MLSFPISFYVFFYYVIQPILVRPCNMPMLSVDKYIIILYSILYFKNRFAKKFVRVSFDITSFKSISYMEFYKKTMEPKVALEAKELLIGLSYSTVA